MVRRRICSAIRITIVSNNKLNTILVFSQFLFRKINAEMIVIGRVPSHRPCWVSSGNGVVFTCNSNKS